MKLAYAVIRVPNIIKNPPKDKLLIKSWELPRIASHAVQLYKSKVLPNGVHKKEILTICGEKATLEIKRMMPDGTVKYSIGTRFNNRSTEYMTCKDLKSDWSKCQFAQDKAFCGNPDAIKFNID